MATDGTALTPVPDDRKLEYLLKLNSDQVNGLEGALERNWIAHLVLAGAGLALVFHVGNARELLANYFFHGQYDPIAVATTLLAILLYYFMKLGHLLSFYVEANRLRDRLLRSYLGKDFKQKKLILRKSTSFYVEAFFSLRPIRIHDTFWAYLAVTTTVVSAAQAAALFLAAQAYGVNRWFPPVVLASGAVFICYIVFFKAAHKPKSANALATVLLLLVAAIDLVVSVRCGWPSLILLVAGVLVVTLYLLFWSSNKDYPQTTLAVASSPALAVLWLVVFAWKG
jgi:hypothetical protein